LQTATDEYPEASMFARQAGFRTILAVPLMRAGEAIGVVTLRRTENRPFTDRQIELLKTFASQAVIAIENARLFEEVQARTRALHQESLEYQTAISEVLGVISRSPTNVQPVFDTIARSALHLCAGTFSCVFRFDGRLIHFVAAHGMTPEGFEALRNSYPLPPGPASATTRALETGAVAEIPDVDADPDYEHRHTAGVQNYKSLASVPMLSDGRPIGTVTVGQAKTGRLPPRQIALLRTFADQAVIAIENTRLFEAEQATKRELQKSLEYQTAMSNVLEIISRSPTEVRPVFETILSSAVRLLRAYSGTVTRIEGDQIELAALTTTDDSGDASLRALFPQSVTSEKPHGRAILQGGPINIADAQDDQKISEAVRASARARGYRGWVIVPLLRHGEALGTISVTRREAGGFSDREINLLQTFADQAVIAIENTRLFEAEQLSKRELQEALEYQTATSDVLNVISRSAFDLQVVLDALVKSATRLCNADHAWLFQRECDVFRLAAIHGTIADTEMRLREFFKAEKVPVNRTSITGRTAQEARVVHISDVLADPEYTWTQAQKIGGYRAALGVPLLLEGHVIGVIFVGKAEPAPFTARQVELVTVFADQAVIAIENTRLFEEVQSRTRELAKTVEDLEIASQHKSQFVANMSHELRTPLAAILGYAELMQEGFYEPLGQKSLDALTRIRSNGKHLLGLINTVLDIAKIESGQFTLNMGEYAVESVVETVRSATESLAQNKKLALKTDVAKSLPFGLGDEQRLTQVLLNLVGNAIKFTHTGEVRIAATAANGAFAVSVADTGPGIPPDQLTRVFEQFHQVDSSNTKAKGGTGLGLAISKQIVEMHGGRIWVESTLGKGSVFHMELPTRAEFR
jgi:signal transduction histidine kinase